MLVSHEKKFIYLKCGKTASTSTEAFLQPYCGDTQCRTNVTQVSTQGIVSHPFHPLPGTEFRAHMPAQELKSILGDDIWEGYYKFANVRNPFDTVVSQYFDQKPYYKEDLTFEVWWWEKRPRDDIIWNIIEINDCLVTDYVIRYETLLDDVERVCELLEINFDPTAFPQLRTTERPSRDGGKLAYQEVITDALLIDDIRTVFERTCTKFGYDY